HPTLARRATEYNTMPPRRSRVTNPIWFEEPPCRPPGQESHQDRDSSGPSSFLCCLAWRRVAPPALQVRHQRLRDASEVGAAPLLWPRPLGLIPGAGRLSPAPSPISHSS